MMSEKTSVEISRTQSPEDEDIVPLEELGEGFANTFRDDNEHQEGNHGFLNFFYFSKGEPHRTTAKALVGGAIVCICLIFILLPILYNINFIPSKGREIDWGEKYKSNINMSQIRENMEWFSSKAHIAGSPRDRETAERTRDLFESFGFKTDIIEQIVMLPNPVYEKDAYIVQLKTDSKVEYQAKLKEEVISQDPTSANEAPPPFNGWSANGDVEGNVVYANYGRKEDYEALIKNNITVKDKIVIVRYGAGIFRGNKAKFAEDLEAKGVLIYSDPADVVKGPTYPLGPWKPPSSVQRGSVWIGDGDPSTPGWASTPEAPHLNYSQAQDEILSLNTPLPKIPIQCLSYEDAEPIMRALSLNGSVLVKDDDSFSGWQGKFDFDYRVLSSNITTVRLKVTTNITLTPIWTVVGKITGNQYPNRQILIGAHRDAWTMGAVDPISGTSILLNVAETFSKLLEEGWKPSRTILFCSWDAEEQGLIGSIEYGQQFNNILTSQAVAYINLDTAVSGTDDFVAAGTPQMNQFATEIFQKVKTSEGVTVFDDWRAPKRLEKLGSGSDQVIFIHNLGIPSFDLKYQSSDEAYESVYHSNYDSFFWMTNFGDPDFKYHGIMSEVIGRLAIELIDAEIIPFNYIDYAQELQSYVEDLQSQLSSNQDVSFEPLEMAIQILRDAATKTYTDTENLKTRRKELREKEVNLIHTTGLTQETNIELRKEEALLAIEFEALNDRLILTERGMLSQYGLPGRPFFKHIVFAPSAKNAYAGAGFPSITDALTDDNMALAEAQIRIASQLIISAAETLDGTS